MRWRRPLSICPSSPPCVLMSPPTRHRVNRRQKPDGDRTSMLTRRTLGAGIITRASERTLDHACHSSDAHPLAPAPYYPPYPAQRARPIWSFTASPPSLARSSTPTQPRTFFIPFSSYSRRTCTSLTWVDGAGPRSSESAVQYPRDDPAAHGQDPQRRSYRRGQAILGPARQDRLGRRGRYSPRRSGPVDIRPREPGQSESGVGWRR